MIESDQEPPENKGIVKSALELLEACDFHRNVWMTTEGSSISECAVRKLDKIVTDVLIIPTLACLGQHFDRWMKTPGPRKKFHVTMTLWFVRYTFTTMYSYNIDLLNNLGSPPRNLQLFYRRSHLLHDLQMLLDEFDKCWIGACGHAHGP
ncbi:hypothetical protein F5B22DRAFT_646154 [Xylaria bambusicola]|uniref:uncharacterized protein n=1 Tax=Xylaria bambusicola TaxID=326684 RepID=UPI0020078E25|nr:uncharacterized protein F5B22DRAFT_646154 [Xylaria bambusicola]KAI0517161.1 hypothetical protein F5B22DRAFT_646154 [Xylaria bambusicola]